MSGTAAGAAQRARCTQCRQFLPATGPHVCGKAGRRVVRTPEERRTRETETLRAWRRRNPEKLAAISKRWRERLRMRVLETYGGSPPTCACCGEAMLPFLTLDHENGGGNEHRRALRNRGGTAFYRWLRAEGFPPGFRVLCWNCNYATSGGQTCPHQQE